MTEDQEKALQDLAKAGQEMGEWSARDRQSPQASETLAVEAVRKLVPPREDGEAPEGLMRFAEALANKAAPQEAPQAETPAEKRLAWLHGPASNNVDGYEWGIYRVKWVDGKAAEVWQTNADFSDLDAAIAGTKPDRCKHGVRFPHECTDCIYEDQQ